MKEQKQTIIFIDSGDTLVDESTEVYWNETELVLEADLIPGAYETVKRLKELGFTVIMVADGLKRSFYNVHTQHGLYDCYDGFAISEEVGVCKPSSKMFDAGFKAAGIGKDEAYRVVMVGNNLARDINGANDYGITSIHIDWSPRYIHVPENDNEIPDYTVHKPEELIPLMLEIEAENIARMEQ